MDQYWMSDEATTDLVDLPPPRAQYTPVESPWVESPWTDNPPPTPTRQQLWEARLGQLGQRLHTIRYAEIRVRQVDLWFAMAASAALGAISVIGILELFG